MMVVKIRRRMDVKNAWELKWIGASSLDPSLIASSENAQYILSSSLHCAENSASDTSPRPVHSPLHAVELQLLHKSTQKKHRKTHTTLLWPRLHWTLKLIADILNQGFYCFTLYCWAPQHLDPFLHWCYFSDQSFTILGIWKFTIMQLCRAFWATTITNNQ